MAGIIIAVSTDATIISRTATAPLQRAIADSSAEIETQGSPTARSHDTSIPSLHVRVKRKIEFDLSVEDQSRAGLGGVRLCR